MGILRTNKISGLETPTAVTGSVYFDGVSNDSLQIANNTDFDFPGDFTIECWAYSITALDSYNIEFAHILGKGNGIVAQTYALGFYQSKVNFTTSNSGGTYTVRQGSSLLTNNTWYHFAVTRQSNILRLFVNGKVDYSVTVSDDLTNTKSFNIGDRESGDPSANYPMNGYISNLRILKGTALYTSDFTVPTHELEVIGDTVLLCCNNPDSAGADGTGKTITVKGDAAASTFSPGLTRDFTFGTQFEGVTTFDTQGYFVPPSGTITERSPDFAGVDAASARGLFISGGVSPGTTAVNTIDFITIATTGDAQDFGDLTTVARRAAGCSSSTRGLVAGGYRAPVYANTIDYVTISSTGDGQDFGDLLGAQWAKGSCSNSTRGIWAGGYSNVSPFNIRTIEYVTIQSQGNSIRFGELSTTTGLRELGAAASTTRGLFAGGRTTTPSTVDKNIIEYVTISSTGNPVDFGDLSAARTTVSGASSSTRAVFFGGFENPGAVNTIEFVTIASLGDATNFGDLTLSRYLMGSTSSKIRATSGGGTGVTNVIDYVTIASAGDAQNFGDLTAARQELAAVSNGHGGLG